MTMVFEGAPKFGGISGDHARVTAIEDRVLIRAIDAMAEEPVTIAMTPDQARALAAGIVAAANDAEAHQPTMTVATRPAPDAVAHLVEAAQALGATPEGYCFCSTNRIGDDSKAHEPECADLRAALVKMENEQCQVSIGPAIGATINGLHGSGAGAPDAVDNSYTDDLIDLIGEFGREVYYLLDDCETSGPVGEEIHTITEDGLRKVSAIIDRIDDLPFEEPGVILGTGAMLQAAIMQTFAHPPQPSASVVEAMKQETSHDRT